MVQVYPPPAPGGYTWSKCIRPWAQKVPLGPKSAQKKPGADTLGPSVSAPGFFGGGLRNWIYSSLRSCASCARWAELGRAGENGGLAWSRTPRVGPDPHATVLSLHLFSHTHGHDAVIYQAIRLTSNWRHPRTSHWYHSYCHGHRFLGRRLHASLFAFLCRVGYA